MATTEWEKEVALGEKLIERYGAEFNITTALANKVFNGTATAEETAHYVSAAEGMVARFRSEIIYKKIEDYTDSDLSLVMATADANYRYVKFDPTQHSEPESIRKVVPTGWASSQLAKTPEQLKDPESLPTLGGSIALKRYSQDLSPPQVVSQFGLDYQGTPYLTEDGAAIVRQPYLFAVDAPITPEYTQSAKLPMDPRLALRVQRLAAQGPKSAVGKQAAEFFSSYKDKLLLIPRADTAAERDRIITSCDSIYKALNQDPSRIKAQELPYTGTTMPYYGAALAQDKPYADPVQEMYLAERPPLPHGATLSFSVSKDPRAMAERSDKPAGSASFKLATWDAKQSRWTVDKGAVREAERALKTRVAAYPPHLRDKYTADFKQFTSSLPLDPKPVQDKVREDGRTKRVIRKHVEEMDGRARRKALDARRRKARAAGDAS